METKLFAIPRGFAEKWITALRSGDYEQGKSALKSENKYCCLGVACAINGFTELGKAQFIAPNNTFGITANNGTKDINKIIKSIPKLLIGNEKNHFVELVTDMNDNDKSFEEIADWIEQNVEFI